MTTTITSPTTFDLFTWHPEPLAEWLADHPDYVPEPELEESSSSAPVASELPDLPVFGTITITTSRWDSWSFSRPTTTTRTLT